MLCAAAAARRGGQVPLDLLTGPVAVAYGSGPLLRWLLQWLGIGINAVVILTLPSAAAAGGLASAVFTWCLIQTPVLAALVWWIRRPRATD